MITNVPAGGGYSLYGLSTILLVLALRDGELSILYPVISLTYVWVTVLSFAFLKSRSHLQAGRHFDHCRSGVAVLGRNGRK